MAESPKSKRKLKPAPVTVRQKAQAATDAPKKTRRVRKTVTSAGNIIRSGRNFGRREYYLPIPDTKVGRFLNKRRYFVPKFIREAWAELKLVTWPNRKETTKLTIAVFTFAIVFGILVAVTDYGLDQLFKRTVLK